MRDPDDLPSFRELVFSDLARYTRARPSWLQVLARCFVDPGLIAILVLRAQQTLHRSGRTRAARVLRTVGVVTVGAEFVPGVTVGKALWMPHPVGVVLGSGAVVGDNVTILQGVTLGAKIPDPTIEQDFPVVDDGAILLSHATVVGGVRVGTHAQVGANSLVVSDVPAYAIVLGVPAEKVGSRAVDALNRSLHHQRSRRDVVG